MQRDYTSYPSDQKDTLSRASLMFVSLAIVMLGWTMGGCGKEFLGMGRLATTFPATTNDGYLIDKGSIQFCTRPEAASQLNCQGCQTASNGELLCQAELAPGKWGWKLSLQVPKGSKKIFCDMQERLVLIEEGKLTEDFVQLTCSDGSTVTTGRLEVCVGVDTTNAPDQRCLLKETTQEANAEPSLVDAGATEGNAPPCASDTDCPPQQACLAGSCVVEPPISSCKSDADCAAGEFCDKGGSCQPSPVPPAGCTKDSDCKSGERCVQGSCSTAGPPVDCSVSCAGKCGVLNNGCACSTCSQPWVCGASNQCECPLDACGTACVDTKTNLNHCGACNKKCSSFCVQGQCVPCRVDSDCGSGMSCKNNQCVALGPVCGDGKCESGETCGNCTSDCGCSGSNICQLGRCVAPCSYTKASQTYSGTGSGGTRGGEIFSLDIVSLNASTGQVCFEIRKKDGSLMSAGRTYDLRVTGSPTLGCRDFNVIRRSWAGGAASYRACESIGTFLPGEMTKYFCFSARTKLGDPGYDSTNKSQEAWWVSPLKGVTRSATCP